MRGITVKISSLEQKALFVSFLFHVAFAQAIVLTFPLPSVDRRPFFNFLGGVLETTDFSQPAEGREKILSRRETVRSQDIVAATSPFEPGQTKISVKQGLAGGAKSEGKKFLKDDFTTPSPKTDAGRVLKGLGVTPPKDYVPLKMDRIQF